MMTQTKERKAVIEPEETTTVVDDSNSLGQIKINHSVVASIVRLAALEVEGVHAVGGGLVDGIAEIFSKKESDRGVRVTEDDNGQYIIDVRVILKFGVELARVAVAIQENVNQQVSHMTMKGVNRVNIIIDGVKLQESYVSSNHDEEWTHEAHTD